MYRLGLFENVAAYMSMPKVSSTPTAESRSALDGALASAARRSCLGAGFAMRHIAQNERRHEQRTRVSYRIPFLLPQSCCRRPTLLCCLLCVDLRRTDADNGISVKSSCESGEEGEGGGVTLFALEQYLRQERSQEEDTSELKN